MGLVHYFFVSIVEIEKGKKRTLHNLLHIGSALQMKEQQRNRSFLVLLALTGRRGSAQPVGSAGLQLGLCRVKLLFAMSLGCLQSWVNLSRTKVRSLKVED